MDSGCLFGDLDWTVEDGPTYNSCALFSIAGMNEATLCSDVAFDLSNLIKRHMTFLAHDIHNLHMEGMS